jgi:hypothetical protein
MVNQEYAVIARDTGGMGSHALKVGIRLELFVTLRKQKNKEMKRLKRALFSRDADATPHWRHGPRQPGGQQSSCATRSDPCPQIVRPCMRKHQSDR